MGVEDRRLGVPGAARRPPRGRARSPRAPRRAPRRGARARARGVGRALGRRAGGPRRGGARARWRRRPRPATPESTSPAAGAATSAGSAARARRAPGAARRAAGRDAVAEALVGQRAQRLQRLGGLRPRRADDQRVAEARAERDDVGQARRAHRRAAALLGHAHLGVVVARDPDEARRRPRVQADRVADLQALLGVGAASAGASAAPARRGAGLDAELRRLHGQRAARLGGHLLERGAAARGHRRGHRALHERRLAHQHAPGGAARASRSRTRRS